MRRSRTEASIYPDDVVVITDRNVARLMSCALDLGPDNGVDATFVKRLRQRRRERGPV